MSLRRRLARNAKRSPFEAGPGTTLEEVLAAYRQGRPIKCGSEQILAAVAKCLQGQAVSVRVLHDSACSPIACRCEPEFLLEKLTPENYLEGQAAQAKWAKESLS